MLTDEEIQFNRQIALDALRLNPAAHRKISGRLTDETDGYCAIGHIGEALHVSPKLHKDSEVYHAVEGKLNLKNSNTVWHMNDGGYTYLEIARKLAKMWNMD